MWVEAMCDRLVNLDRMDSIVLKRLDDRGEWRIVAFKGGRARHLGAFVTREKARHAVLKLMARMGHAATLHGEEGSVLRNKIMETAGQMENLRNKIMETAGQMEKMGQYTSPGVNDMANRCARMVLGLLEDLKEPDVAK